MEANLYKKLQLIKIFSSLRNQYNPKHYKSTYYTKLFNIDY